MRNKLRKLHFIIFPLFTLLLAESIRAQSDPKYIVEVLSQSLPVYDDELNEVAKIRKSTFKKDFTSHSIESGDEIDGVAIIEAANEGELGLELIKVEISDHGPVWVELSKVEVWPAKQVICPKGALAKEDGTTVGGSVGFGGECTDQ